MTLPQTEVEATILSFAAAGLGAGALGAQAVSAEGTNARVRANATSRLVLRVLIRLVML